MKFQKFYALAAIAFMVLSIMVTSCSKDETPIDLPGTTDPETIELSFVGSDACASCHSNHYEKFIKSGHPYKLNKVNGSQPIIPYTTAEGLDIPLPAGYEWSDITYMIGGYGWKARFLDSEGYIITQYSDTQYNLEDGSQLAYHAGDPVGTKKYDCGKCHTTGWKHVDDGGEPKDGLAGMAGYFFAGGVHCEECHGMGSLHVETSNPSHIVIDNSSLACGKCHTRNADRSIAAKGGFVKHHEQYDEWLVSGGHRASEIGCNTCHDPHSSVVNDAIAPGEGVTKACTDCHSGYNGNKHNEYEIDCITCHMPYLAKSAIKTGDYKGDIRSHQFRINPSTQYTQFNAAGNLSNNEGISLDYACYQCHKDMFGKGGNASSKTRLYLASKALNFHD